jgi:hypothetical protein
MAEFALMMVAVSDYEYSESLPSLETAARVEELFQPLGLTHVRRPDSTTTAADLVASLDAWATDGGGPGATFVYWVGHGSREGNDAWLLAGQSKSPLTEARAVNAKTVASLLRTRWTERTAGDGSWTVLVLDCCRGGDAANAIIHVLTEDGAGRPSELAIVEAGGKSAN